MKIEFTKKDCQFILTELMKVYTKETKLIGKNKVFQKKDFDVRIDAKFLNDKLKSVTFKSMKEFNGIYKNNSITLDKDLQHNPKNLIKVIIHELVHHIQVHCFCEGSYKLFCMYYLLNGDSLERDAERFAKLLHKKFEFD